MLVLVNHAAASSRPPSQPLQHMLVPVHRRCRWKQKGSSLQHLRCPLMRRTEAEAQVQPSKVPR